MAQRFYVSSLKIKMSGNYQNGRGLITFEAERIDLWMH